MTSVIAFIVILTAAANVAIATADLSRAKFVLANGVEVGVPPDWLPKLASLKMAGGLGLLLWFMHVPVIPLAAAAGLVAFYLGAITTHLRARVYYNLVFPGTFLALATATLVLISIRPHS